MVTNEQITATFSKRVNDLRRSLKHFQSRNMTEHATRTEERLDELKVILSLLADEEEQNP